MSEKLKKGDRVRYTGAYKEYNDSSVVGAVGTVTSVKTDTVRVDWERLGRRTPAGSVFKQNVEVIQPSLKKGDRVTHKESDFFPGTHRLTSEPYVKWGTTVVDAVSETDGEANVFTVEFLTKVEEPVKVGDRVLVHEAIGLFKGRQPGHLATVLEVDPAGQKGRLRVKADEAIDGSWTKFYADSWTLAPKFQAGDRVRAERSGPTGTSPRGEWVEGVLIHDTGLEQTNELLLKKDDGHRVFVYADTAKKVEPVKPLRAGTVVTSGRGAYLVGRERASYTSYHGEVIYASTPQQLAEWVRDKPGQFQIVHEPATA